MSAVAESPLIAAKGCFAYPLFDRFADRMCSDLYPPSKWVRTGPVKDRKMSSNARAHLDTS